MHELWLYNWLSRFGRLNYRAKIMLMAFIGTHIPLIALASYLALQSSPNWQVFVVTVGVTLVATLVGTGITLFVLHQLLRPVLLTSRALRLYRESRRTGALPTHYIDEVGRLMADADATMEHLETARDALEHVDEITGLPNRKKLLQLMNHRATLGLRFAVAVIRFSNLPRIAETLDMAHADEAAQLLARRLEKHIEPGWIAARIGKSDFALLCAESDGHLIAGTQIAARLRDLLEACAYELPLVDMSVKPQLLCGVSVHPDDQNEVEKLLDYAIAAASQATLASPVIPHSPAARKAALERLTIEQELRRALDREEFCLYFQPLIDLKADQMTGAEALIRWQHPQRGLVGPNVFIPAAEASGLIEPIGSWVIHQACEQLRQWNEAGSRHLRVAINLSARQFLNRHLNTQIAQTIACASIDPRQLEIELTETSAMVDLKHTQTMLALLRDLGVRIAIDDFGTGYASMSYLSHLPFDKLKIDREFVTDVDQKRGAQAICKSLIALSHGLGLEVVAEGTEKEQEVGYLSANGCHLFQGYFFAKPLPSDKLMATCNAMPEFLASLHERAVAERRDPQSVGGSLR